MGRKRCAINSCLLPLASTITFFRLPVNDDEREKWSDFIKSVNKDENWIPPKNSFVCSLHFRECCTKSSGSRSLVLPGHSPTIVNGIQIINECTAQSNAYENEIDMIDHSSENTDCDNCISLKIKLDKLQDSLNSALQNWALLRCVHKEALKELHVLKQKDKRGQLKRKNNVEITTTANKLTSRVVNFKNEKMKVKLMTHLFSQSVAKSLDVCRIIKIPGFENSEATSKFVKLCDRLFDALNSKPTGTGFKSPLSAGNMRYWSALFKEAKNYLMGLECKIQFKVKVNGEVETREKWILLKDSRRNTCVKGLFTCISSIELLLNDMSAGLIDLSYLPVYKFCQDSIEIFFSVLRSRFGNNNNPNSTQLESALKRVICMNIKPTNSGNCSIEDDFSTKICPVGRISVDDTCQDENEYDAEDDELPEIPDIITLSQFVSNVVAYIAGFVGRSLFKKIKCADCIAALVPEDMAAVRSRSDFILINEKDNGGLFIPSSDLVKVCEISEKEIRCSQSQGLSNINKQVIVQNVLKRSSQSEVFQKLRTTSSNSHPLFDNHVIDLIQKIAEEYSKIRLHYMAKAATLKLSPESNRSVCTKAVHFQGN